MRMRGDRGAPAAEETDSWTQSSSQRGISLVPWVTLLLGTRKRLKARKQLPESQTTWGKLLGADIPKSAAVGWEEGGYW